MQRRLGNAGTREWKITESSSIRAERDSGIAPGVEMLQHYLRWLGTRINAETRQSLSRGHPCGQAVSCAARSKGSQRAICQDPQPVMV